MTHIAPVSQIARTLLSPLLLAAPLQVETLCSHDKLLWQKDQPHFDHLLL